MFPQWHPTGTKATMYPSDGEVVVVIRPDGSSAKMKYSKGLWFIGPDYAVHTYFTPTFWRPREVGE